MNDIQKEFETLYKEWQELIKSPEIMIHSNTSYYTDLDPYDSIINMGMIVLPLIIGKLRMGEFFMNKAVSSITGLSIKHITTKKYISEQDIAKAWIEWWDKE